MKYSFYSLFFFFLFSCSPFSKKGSSTFFANVSSNNAFVLKKNPVVISGSHSLASNTDLNKYLDKTQVFITKKGELRLDCFFEEGENFYQDCLQVFLRLNDTAFLKPNSGNKWGFNANSSEFLQVQTFYHLKKGIEQIIDAEKNWYNQRTQSASFSGIPFDLFEFKQSLSFWNATETLKAYAQCQKMDNAYFSPSTFSLCFGESEVLPGMNFAQDPSVIYHELGHVMVYLFSNLRNTELDEKTNLGIATKGTESTAINEGIADYFSYVMTNRTSLAEWSLGLSNSQFARADRPISESSPLHTKVLSEQPGGRLIYPENQLHQAQDPNFPNASPQVGGQVTSHFLYALTKGVEASCSLPVDQSKNFVIGLIMETLAKAGDLTTRGSNINLPGHINFHPEIAEQFKSYDKSYNYRTFYQVFARQFITFSPSLNCGPLDNKEYIEDLLDQYGILLFDNYNFDGGNTLGTDERVVNPSNRAFTSVTNIDSLTLSTDGVLYYVVDGQQSLQKYIESAILQNPTSVNLSPSIPATLPYNNGNGKLDPGEIVGLSLNLKNNSGLPIGGVEVLATPFDHTYKEPGQDRKICTMASFPLSSEGGWPQINPNSPGDCGYTLRNWGSDSDTLEPVCFFKDFSTGSQTWVPQEEFYKNNPFSSSDCLRGNNIKECFMRVLPPNYVSTYPLISPQKTYLETLQGENSQVQSLSTANLIIFEISPNTPSGTEFACRLRARFSNCSNCYHNNTTPNLDDFLDHEFLGARPFKIFHIQGIIGGNN